MTLTRKVLRGVCKHCRHEIEKRGEAWVHLAGISTGREACEPDMQSTLADPLGGGVGQWRAEKDDPELGSPPPPEPMRDGGREVEAEAPPHDPVAAALVAVLEVLAPLDAPTRGRILRAACIFYGVAA